MEIDLGTVPQDVRAALFDLLRGDMEVGGDHGFDLDSKGWVMRDDPDSELPSATVAGAMAYRRALAELSRWAEACSVELRPEFDALLAELLPTDAESRYTAWSRIQGTMEEYPPVRRLYYISHYGITGELLEATVDLREGIRSPKLSEDSTWGF